MKLNVIFWIILSDISKFSETKHILLEIPLVSFLSIDFKGSLIKRFTSFRVILDRFFVEGSKLSVIILPWTSRSLVSNC